MSSLGLDVGTGIDAGVSDCLGNGLGDVIWTYCIEKRFYIRIITIQRCNNIV